MFLRSVPGGDADFALVSETTFLTASSSDVPIMIRVYDINPEGSIQPIHRASFSLPEHSPSTYRHWLRFTYNHTPNQSHDASFCPDAKESIIAIELIAKNMDEARTYTTIFHLKTLMERSGIDSTSASQCNPRGDKPRLYSWEQWGPKHARLLVWEPIHQCSRGTVFGSQYARPIPHTNGTHRLLILEFNPTVPRHYPHRYPPISPTSFSGVVNSRASQPNEQMSTAIHAGHVREPGLNEPMVAQRDELLRYETSTELPFVFDIANCDLHAPSALQMDYEYLFVSYVRLLLQIPWCRIGAWLTMVLIVSQPPDSPSNPHEIGVRWVAYNSAYGVHQTSMPLY